MSLDDSESLCGVSLTSVLVIESSQKDSTGRRPRASAPSHLQEYRLPWRNACIEALGTELYEPTYRIIAINRPMCVEVRYRLRILLYVHRLPPSEHSVHRQFDGCFPAILLAFWFHRWSDTTKLRVDSVVGATQGWRGCGGQH